MVLLFSSRKSKLKQEICEILTARGADYFCDNCCFATGGCFCIYNFFKAPEIKLKRGIALIIDNAEKFKNLSLPLGTLGVCFENDKSALRILQKSGCYTVTCGNNSKNTLTLSSIMEKDYIISLQRELTDINGSKLCAQDFKISVEKSYSNEAVLLATAVLCLLGLITV